MASDTRIGRAFVELFADGRQLTRGLAKAKSQFTTWSRSLTRIGTWSMGIGTGILTPLLAASKLFARTGDAIAEMAQRTGMSTEALSELGHAAKLVGMDAETLEGGIRRMQASIIAAGGKGAKRNLLRDLGVDVRRLTSLKPEEQLNKMADALSGIADPTKRAAAAMKIFGRGGTAMLPLLAGGTQGLARRRSAAAAVGATVTAGEAAAASAYADMLDDLSTGLQSLARAIGEAVAPVATRLAKIVTDNVLTARAWIQSHADLIRLTMRAAVAMLAGGAACIALGGALKVAAVGCGILKIVLGTLLSPIGLTTVALAGIGYALARHTDKGREMVEGLGQRLRGLGEDARLGMSAIVVALKAGNLNAAWDIVAAYAAVVWERIGGSAADSLANMAADVQGRFQNVWDNLRAGWEDLIDWVMVSWKVACDSMATRLEKLRDTLAVLAGGMSQAVGAAVKSMTSSVANNYRREGHPGAYSPGHLLFGRLPGGQMSIGPDAAIGAAQTGLGSVLNWLWPKGKTAAQKRDWYASARQEHEAKMAEIGAASLAREEARAAERLRRSNARAHELYNAEEAYRAALKRATHDMSPLRPEEGPPPKDWSILYTYEPPAGKALEVPGMEATKRELSVVGTFNPRVMGMLAGGAAQERAARAAEETARNTGQLVNQGRRNRRGNTFG